jgi:hypothetical protein
LDAGERDDRPTTEMAEGADARQRRVRSLVRGDLLDAVESGTVPG